ncbi:MAG: restriction endonuclease subunit M, partial [Caldisericia bacterium]|nr:restriction endonuclease subunit M [Caldisericia bacterium]
MSVPEKIVELVEHFDSHIDELKAKNYKEASLCTDFLNPFFHALDWDVYNKKGYAERFRDVVQQYSEKSEGGTTKQPDYLFRIGASPVFFLEAKKPAVDILTDRKPAYQLRRYGWNRKDIGVSILSDFEHLCFYDVRIQPKESERPHFARLAMYGYKDFITKWEEIHGYLARENVAKGSLDRLLKDYEVKGKKEPVDESLLKMIELWREKLARNIALRNKQLDIGQLNSAVQRTIDRILFLRICEDRGIENPNQLLGTKNGKNIYARLIKQFQDADVRYNSGLFHFNPEKGRPAEYDNFTLGLKIDDDELKEIISNLYPPNYPFDFSVMPVDILGHVYERFLGKVIRLTDSHQAKVEEKPEVRKAGGVYYTPKYIVDYIVKNTVGKLVEG